MAEAKQPISIDDAIRLKHHMEDRIHSAVTDFQTLVGLSVRSIDVTRRDLIGVRPSHAYVEIDAQIEFLK